MYQQTNNPVFQATTRREPPHREMSTFGPTPSAAHFASVDAAFFGRPQPTHKLITVADLARPPEMPDAVKAEGLKGKTCLYGFEYPDSAVAAYDESRGITDKCPEGGDSRSWMADRKRAIMRDLARKHGMVVFTSLAMVSSHVGTTRFSGACHEDVVYFAYMSDRKLVAPMCPNVERIKQLKQAMRVEEGEVRWIVV